VHNSLPHFKTTESESSLASKAKRSVSSPAHIGSTVTLTSQTHMYLQQRTASRCTIISVNQHFAQTISLFTSIASSKLRDPKRQGSSNFEAGLTRPARQSIRYRTHVQGWHSLTTYSNTFRTTIISIGTGNLKPNRASFPPPQQPHPDPIQQTYPRLVAKLNSTLQIPPQ
jgi:hypothetical protein